MPAPSADTVPNVVSDTFFDLQTFKDLGVRLDKLEDPSEKGLMPRMRHAAQVAVRKNMDPYSALRLTHGFVRDEMELVQGMIQAATQRVNLETPAIKEFMQRQEAAGKQPQLDERKLRMANLGFIWPMLVTPAETETGRPFRQIAIPASSYYDKSQPLAVADQLANARVVLTSVI